MHCWVKSDICEFDTGISLNKCHHIIIEIRFEFFNMNWNNNSYITGPCLKECYFGKLWSTIALLVKTMNIIFAFNFKNT